MPAFIRESVGYIENLSTEDRFRERHGGDRLDSGAIIVIASPGGIQGVFWSQTARRSLYRLAATSPTVLEEETGRHVAVAHDRRFEEPANDVRRFLESGRTSNLVDF